MTQSEIDELFERMNPKRSHWPHRWEDMREGFRQAMSLIEPWGFWSKGCGFFDTTTHPQDHTQLYRIKEPK